MCFISQHCCGLWIYCCVLHFLVCLIVHDFRLLSQSWWDLRSSGILCSIQWKFLTYVSGHTIGSILKGWESLKRGLIGCPEMLIRNYHYMLCNIAEEHTQILFNYGLSAHISCMERWMWLIGWGCCRRKRLCVCRHFA